VAGLAIEEFRALTASMGLAGTAADNLKDIMGRLGAAERATAAAGKIAAATGQEINAVRSAMAAANAEAAASEKRLADAIKATAKAAEASSKRAEGAQKKDASDMVERFRARTKEAARSKEWARQRAADELSGRSPAQVSKWFAELQKQSKRGDDVFLGMRTQLIQTAREIGPVIAAVTALAVGLGKLALMAISATQAKQQLQASLGAFLGTGTAGAKVLLDQIDRLAARLPYTSAKLREWGQAFIEAGIRGEGLRASIEAVASATAIMGEAGGKAASDLILKFREMARVRLAVRLSPDVIQDLAKAGISAQVLAKELGVTPARLRLISVRAGDLGDVMQRILLKQGAGPLNQMGLSLDSIREKLSEGLTAAFSDLGDIVTPFMAQLRSLASEFFKGSIAGKGTASVIRTVLTPAFEVATRTTRAAHIALLYLEIAYLKAAIALRPLTSALDKLGVSGKVVSVAMYLIAGTAVVLAVVLGVVALAIGLVAAPFIIFGTVLAYVGGLISDAIDHFDDLKSGLGDAADGMVQAVNSFASNAGTALQNFVMSAAKAGLNFVVGLVQALLTGSGPVADAVKSLAASAVSALFGALQIKSPSRISQKAGGFFTAGFVEEVEDGAADAHAAAKGMANAAASGLTSSRKKGKGSGGGAGDKVFQFINCTFGGNLTQEKVDDMMMAWWEKISASGEEPEPT